VMEKDKKTENKRISFGRLVTMLVLTSLTAFIISFSTWFFVNLGESNVAKTNESNIDMLQSQILQLKVAVKTQETLAKNNVAIGSSSTRNQ
jgi:hypothetical protein